MFKHCTRCDSRYDNLKDNLCPRCRVRLAVVLEPGDRVGPFEIVEKLPEGDGGMAKVYQAHWAGTESIVALKVAVDRPYEAGGLKREAEVLSQMEHPNIVRIFQLPAPQNDAKYYVGHQVLDGVSHVYIALEYIAGPSLRQRMQSKPALSLDEIVDIVRQAGRALSYAHHRNVLHLDIKPSNILLDENGHVFVTDFGVATPANPRQQRPGGHTAGTARYMSPEHATRANVDYRSDIFSLGVVLYEMLTNTIAFGGQTTRRTLTAVINESPPPPSSINPRVPPALDEVVGRALEKDKTQRYQSTQEFVEAVERATSSRWRTWAVAAVVLAAMAVILLVLFGELGSQAFVGVPTATFEVQSVATATATPRPPASPTPVPTLAEPTTTPIPIIAATRTPVRPPRATSTLAPTATLAATATPSTETNAAEPTQSANAATGSIQLLEPADEARVTDLVTFRWAWPGNLGSSETFDVRVCKGTACQPEFGKVNTADRVWQWCPTDGGGPYRWQVLVIDAQSKRVIGPVSEVRNFDWGGAGGSCRSETNREKPPPPPPTVTSSAYPGYP